MTIAHTLPAPIFDTASDLAGELVLRPLDYRACQRLQVLGVSGRFVAELNARCLIGAGRVQLSRDGGRWEPEGPDARLLLAMTDGGELADIAAVSTSHPDQVAQRTGAGWCIGEEAYDFAAARALAGGHVRLRIFANALEWLRGHGEGIVVLDWAQAVTPLRCLGERVTLECPPQLSAVVRGRLERGGLPRVSGPVSIEGLSLAERIGRAA